MSKRNPAAVSFFRKTGSAWQQRWFEGPDGVAAHITPEVLESLLRGAYRQGRIFERRRADRELAERDAILQQTERVMEAALERRDAELLRAKPLLDGAASFDLLIADVVWLIAGVRLASGPDGPAVELPDRHRLADLRQALQRLNPLPEKELPF